MVAKPAMVSISQGLLVRGLLLAIPMLLGFAVAWAVRRRAAAPASPGDPLGFGWACVALSALVLALAAGLHEDGPGLLYLAAAAMAWGTVGWALGVVQRRAAPRHVVMVAVVIGALAALHVGLVAGQPGGSLGGGDRLYHEPIVDNLLQFHKASEGTLKSYEYYPGYHVVAAMVSQATGFDAKAAINALAMAVAFGVPVLLAATLLAVQRDPAVALGGGALLALAPSFLHFMAYFIPQSYSFAFFVLAVHVLLARQGDLGATVLMLLALVAWVATHQVSLLIAGLVLLALQAAYYIAVRPALPTPQRQATRFWFFPVALFIAAAGYAVFVSAFLSKSIFQFFRVTDVRFDADGVVGEATASQTLQAYWLTLSTPSTFLLARLVVGLLLFLAVYLAVTALRQRATLPPWGRGLVIALLLVGVAYFPNPLWTLQFFDKFLNIVRWTLFTEVVAVLVAALAVGHLVPRLTRGVERPAVLAIVLAAVCLAGLTSDSAGSQLWVEEDQNQARPMSFSPAELKGLQLVSEGRLPDQVFMADHQQAWFVRGDRLPTPAYALSVLDDERLNVPDTGLVFLRNGAIEVLERHGVRPCTDWFHTVFQNPDVAIFASNGHDVCDATESAP